MAQQTEPSHKDVIAAMKAFIPWNVNPGNPDLANEYRRLMNKRKALRRALRGK